MTGRPRRIACRALEAVGLLGGLSVLGVAATVWAVEPGGADRAATLRRLQDEIGRLEEQLRSLGAREQGLLGQLERLAAETRLRETERSEVALRLEDLVAAIDERTGRLERLAQLQDQRRRYLSFRLREIYKAGPQGRLRHLFGGATAGDLRSGLLYAAYYSERDGRVLDQLRVDAERLAGERRGLEEEQLRQVALQSELEQATQRLLRTRAEQAKLLGDVRQDQRRRRDALAELRAAADDLTRVVDSLGEKAEQRKLDVRKFKGLLRWPAEGRLSAGFGTLVHPRFKTRVPHPGLDLDAPADSAIGSVFDGRVVFAEWLRGYGLTVIVDHGQGVLSVYSHASVVLVEVGEQVAQGQRLALVGDSGSLRGAFLYFELRVDGQPVDPLSWFAHR